MSLAVVFPGQGSQSVGMLGDFFTQNGISEQAQSHIRQVFQECSDAINIDLWQLTQAGSESELSRTENTQPALLAASVALFRAFSLSAPVATVMAGHSLGEYSALVCAGSIELSEATKLVRLRGQLMQAAVPVGVGAMAAVLNADLALIEQTCADAAQGEVIEPANLNAPGQIVISGHAAALERALALLAERGARKAIRLPVSVPSHCGLMRSAAQELAKALADVAIKAPSIRVVHNISADFCADAHTIRAALVGQLYSRVRWIESVQKLKAEGATRVVECGPGKALSGMIKRIEPELPTMTIGNAVDFLAASDG
jgi:[acyl-carrier-protein] S-malonyltransferase